VQLQLKTWQFVEDYLKSKTGIIIPIGSTEQHGPTGLIGTDALTAEMIGRGVGEKVGALVAPTISVGMAQHHLAFPGTMTVRPSTLIALIRDHVMSLARHGFTRFYFLNGHGGNIATVTASFSEIYAERSLERMSNQPPLKCVLRNWWESSGVTSLRRELYGGSEGSHATPSEVALTWYRFPETMQQKPMEPRVLYRCRGLPPRLSRRPYRLGSEPGDARAWQADLRDRRRGRGAGLRVLGGAVGRL
jgi:creatinine amidohydrolase